MSKLMNHETNTNVSSTMRTYNVHTSKRACAKRVGTKRVGATLIDVAIGSMLLTVLLIPAVHMVGKSQSANRRLTNRAIMLYESEQAIENLKVVLSEPLAFDSAMNTPIDDIRVIPVSDGPDLVGRRRVAADPTMPTAQLVTIVSDVWYDADKDAVFDADEQGETLHTQWSAP